VIVSWDSPQEKISIFGSYPFEIFSKNLGNGDKFYFRDETNGGEDSGHLREFGPNKMY